MYLGTETWTCDKLSWLYADRLHQKDILNKRLKEDNKIQEKKRVAPNETNKERKYSWEFPWKKEINNVILSKKKGEKFDVK